MIMKSALLTLPFLFFTFITKLPLAFSDESEPVLDTNGKPILPGVKYYIGPAFMGPNSGGITLGETVNSNCPVTVLQHHSEIVNGLPIIFNTLVLHSDIIRTGIPVDIEFTESSECAESSRWLVFMDDETQKACVGIGSPEDHPGQQTQSGTFNIQKFEGVGYKIVFCVSASSTCLDIGTYDANNSKGGPRLSLTKNNTFQVVFIDAFDFNGIIRSVV